VFKGIPTSPFNSCLDDCLTRVLNRPMPTPIFAFRLAESEQAALVDMSKLYGSKNPSEFLREMVSAMCSGKIERVQDFNARLIRAAGEQLILKLNAVVPPLAVPAPTVAKRGRKGGRRARRVP